MKILGVEVNNHRKVLVVKLHSEALVLPFSKLRVIPKPSDPIIEIFVDKELGSSGITYKLKSGKEDSLHLDAFLDYNKDSEYLRLQRLHQLTLQTYKLFKRSKLSLREVARKLDTSPAQVCRLLDTANTRKTVDQLLRFLDCLDCSVKISAKAA